MHKQNDVAWNAEKAEYIAKELRQADQILVGLGGGFPAAAGVPPLPLDKTLAPEDNWPFWLPYVKAQRLNSNVPALYQQLAQLLAGKTILSSTATPMDFCSAAVWSWPAFTKPRATWPGCSAAITAATTPGSASSILIKWRMPLTTYRPAPTGGAPLVMNVYTGKNFCDAPYQEKNEAYFRFINGSAHNRLAVLELGVGYTMPELIRFPFEQIVMNHKHARLIRINTQHPLCVEENRHKAICVGADIAQVLPQLLQAQQKN